MGGVQGPRRWGDGDLKGERVGEVPKLYAVKYKEKKSEKVLSIDPY